MTNLYAHIKSRGIFLGGRSCRDRSRDRTGKHMSVCRGLDGKRVGAPTLGCYFATCFLAWLSPVYFGVLVNLGFALGSGVLS